MESMNESLLEVSNLTVGYGKREILHEIRFEVKKGEILTLIGQNGVGKSTILKSIMGLLPPVSGHIRWNGVDMAEMTERELARTAAAVLTEHPGTELMTCGEVVAMGRYPYTGRMGILAEADRKAVREAMELFGVWELYETPADRVSDGQRQLVLLARAVAQETEALIMDEPTSYLDIRHRIHFLSAIAELAERKKMAVVMSLHEPELARKISTRLLCVREGEVGPCGPPEEIFSGDTVPMLYGLTRNEWEGYFGANVERRECRKVYF